jgi:hypothetical protein
MSNEIAKTEKRSLVAELANAAGLEPAAYYKTMQEMCGCQGASPENFAGLLMVAKQLGLNPITRQLYLMKTQRGVQVVVPVDGYLSLMRRHPDYLSSTCEMGSDDIGGNYAEVTIFTRSQHAAGLPPFKHREYMKECQGNSGPWRSHPTRMLKHKAYSQAVRYCFGVYAPDEDEWHRAGLAESDEPREVPAEIRPSVELRSLTEAGGVVDEPGTVSGSGVHSSPAPDDEGDDEYTESESARIDAEIAAREGLFDE